MYGSLWNTQVWKFVEHTRMDVYTNIGVNDTCSNRIAPVRFSNSTQGPNHRPNTTYISNYNINPKSNFKPILSQTLILYLNINGAQGIMLPDTISDYMYLSISTFEARQEIFQADVKLFITQEQQQK